MTKESTLDGERGSEMEIDGEVQQSTASPEMKTTEKDIPKQGPTPQSELRTTVQKEVQEEVMRLTAQLQKRLQDSADHLNGAISKLESSIKVRK